MTAFRDRKLKHLPWEDDFGTARLVCVYRTSMFNGRFAYYDLQADSSGWLFKSPLAGAGAYCGGPTTDRITCYLVVQKCTRAHAFFVFSTYAVNQMFCGQRKRVQ